MPNKRQFLIAGAGALVAATSYGIYRYLNQPVEWRDVLELDIPDPALSSLVRNSLDFMGMPNLASEYTSIRRQSILDEH